MSLYFMLNKPKGCITAVRDARHKTVMDYFPEELKKEVFPIGRLDRDTVGLLLITNDGKLAYKLMRPENKVKKTYFLWAKGVITDDDVKKLENGVFILDKKNTFTSPAKVELLDVAKLREIAGLLVGKDCKLNNRHGDEPVFSMKLTITEGKKHQVKRMIAAVGSKVLFLKRISIGGVELDEDLPYGEFRPLTEEEISILEI